MSILEQIEADRIAALRARDMVRRGTLTFIVATARQIAKDAKPPREPTDEDVIRVLRKQIDTMEDNIRLLHAEPERVSGWQNEIDLMRSYLPVMMAEEDLTAFVQKFINSTGEPKTMKMMGSIMAALKATHPGRYDPSMASNIAKTLLQEQQDV